MALNARHLYRSVGHFDYSGDLDTCIAIRTMLFKDGVAYLQGIVLKCTISSICLFI